MGKKLADPPDGLVDIGNRRMHFFKLCYILSHNDTTAVISPTMYEI
jgi:hypothetical protein